MRTIERTTAFKKDYKREKRGRHAKTLDSDLRTLLQALIDDREPDLKYRDHALIGNWSDHRDCHLRPDLILIYRKPDDATLQLVRLGSHSELGL